MKKNVLLTSLFIIGLAMTTQLTSAQSDGGKNVIKLNLSSAGFGHYQLQYERVTGAKQSFALGLGITPKSKLPLSGTISASLDEGSNEKKAFESTRYSKLTITPEYRFYLGKKESPGGFYFSTLLRYSNVKFENEYTYTSESDNKHTFNVDGSMNGYGLGVMIGVQWLLGDVVTLDWWIIGPFGGVMSAEFNGIDDNTLDVLSQEDQDKITTDLNNVEIPLWDLKARVNSNSAFIDVSGPFYGMRFMGLNLGFRF